MSRIGLTLGFYGGIAVVGWVNPIYPLPHPPPPPRAKKNPPANPISNRSTNSSSCPKQKTRHSKKSTSSSASRRPSWCARTSRASRRPPGTCLRCVGVGFSGRVRRASCQRESWSGGWILQLGRRGRGRRRGGRRKEGKRGRGDEGILGGEGGLVQAKLIITKGGGLLAVRDVVGWVE